MHICFNSFLAVTLTMSVTVRLLFKKFSEEFTKF